jgi:hypothetical protein
MEIVELLKAPSLRTNDGARPLRILIDLFETEILASDGFWQRQYID